MAVTKLTEPLGEKRTKIITNFVRSFLLLLLTYYFCFFKNSTPVSGKSVNIPVAPDLFNNECIVHLIYVSEELIKYFYARCMGAITLCIVRALHLVIYFIEVSYISVKCFLINQKRFYRAGYDRFLCDVRNQYDQNIP